ncbi:hypothetical protein O7606_19460 [Micromonospora sp. WMMD882]|uniref:hypothetical protein n=1 Tax=Micromonospora sp. WMMD882 TaxID=3015151 RepID=UPI00248AADA7|nr:hypothetical protein [Micromonospora sp. WMMD882]WBB78389.1 hypothetical protein O7606_19460 [Micromonospora sp. WMMD882]
MPTYVEDRPVTPYRARRLRLLALTVLVALPVGGCGAPPELRHRSAGASTPPAATPTPGGTASPTPTPPALPPTLPPSAPSPGATAVPCRDGPSGERVVRLVRGAAGVLPGSGRVTVRTGPLCADDWHYTVLAVSGYEDLTVVTRGRPTSPKLVTAGTDVCTIEVRTGAPSGIRTLACDGTGILPGALG